MFCIVCKSRICQRSHLCLFKLCRVSGPFQEVEQTAVHDFGALMFFIWGAVYIVMQTYISYKVHPYGSSKRVCHIRAIFSLVAILAVIPSILCVCIIPHYVRSASKRQRGQLFVLFLDFFFFPLTFLTAIICASFLKTNKLHRTSEDKVCHKRCNHFITSQDVSVSSLVVGRMVLLPPYYRLRNASESNVLLLTKKRRLIVCPCVYF